MTFVDAITVLSDRFLRERTFELIVAPAIADLQYNGDEAATHRLGNRLLVAYAFACAVYEEATSDSSLLTFAALVIIPACYYTFLVMACAPPGAEWFDTSRGRVTVGIIISVLSLGPAIACYWPERQPPRAPGEAA
jgi:hypothetical protein